MSDLALIAQDTANLEAAADPAAFVVLACERAKTWLTQALEQGDIDAIVELKSQAEAIRVYTAQKQMGHDAELAAAEIVRRAERGIGVAIRRGQEDGTVAKQGAAGGAARVAAQQTGDTQLLPSPTSFAAPHELYGGGNSTGIYDVTDGVDDDVFEEAITAAKGEGNLSRANVARKVKGQASPVGTQAKVETARSMAAEGYTSRQIGEVVGADGPSFTRRHGIEVPADAQIGKTRRIDSTRVVTEMSHTLEGLVMSAELADPGQVDLIELADLAESIGHSLRSLNRFHKRMKEQL